MTLELDKVVLFLHSPGTSSPSVSVRPFHSVKQLAMRQKPLSLLGLPSEIIHQILSHLPPLSLVELSLTCRALRAYADNDLLWIRFFEENVPLYRVSPRDCGSSWRELYAYHYPYWFLPQHKIWFSNKAHTGSDLTGQLVLARYNYRTECIEAYRFVAELEQGADTFEQWEHNRDVIIHTFNPRVRLWLDDPVVRLGSKVNGPGTRLLKEVQMMQEFTGRWNGIHSTIFLSKAIHPSLQSPSMALWPPRIIPATQRTRNESPNKFRGDAHRPKKFTEVSDQTFRVRKWMEYGGIAGPLGVRMGEDVMTFSTLPEECYVSTKEKPYQGIWVGDYSAHGCEFLLVMQCDVLDHTGPPGRIRRNVITAIPELDDAISTSSSNSEAVVTGPGQESGQEDPIDCRGRLEAIKLTGDPNIPRGEYTWIAEDIGRRGLIRIAEEQKFQGARIVKSWGHIANRGFKDGRRSLM